MDTSIVENVTLEIFMLQFMYLLCGVFLQPLPQSSLRLVISTKDLIISSGNSWVADGIFSVRLSYLVLP